MTKDLNTAFLGHPKPLCSLFFTELWERFAFYGIRPLLIFFMIASVQMGGLEMSRDDASAVVGIFAGCVYIAALPGGWLADNIFGQKRAIFIGSVMMALGYLSISISCFHKFLFFVGLGLIVVGTGLFKTCASVMVGALYTPGDNRRDSGFTIFYMGINMGSLISPIICGLLQEKYGFFIGLGAGGAGMLISLIIFYFWAIKRFDEYDAKIGLNEGWRPIDKINFLKLYKILGVFALFCVLLVCLFYFEILKLDATEISKNMIYVMTFCMVAYFTYLFASPMLNGNEKKNLIALIVFLLAAAVFFSAFEQQPTSYNLFANDFTNRDFFGFEVPAVWAQSLNPVFIIIFAPLAASLWLFLARRGMEISSTAKFAMGLLFAGIGFYIMYFAALEVLSSSSKVSMLWLVVSFFFLTLGEICLSPVGLSIVTKIAPKAIKSQAMGLWFFPSAFGNIIAGLLGANVDANKIEQLPILFENCAIILFISAIILFLLKGYIFRLIGK